MSKKADDELNGQENEMLLDLQEEEKDPIPEGERFTMDLLKRVLPPGRKGLVNEGLVDSLNTLLRDEQLRENFRTNMVGYCGVLKNPRFSIEEYINAVRFVSYRLLGDSLVVAYSKTFPDRFDRLKAKGDFSNFVTAYSRTKLVTSILEQTLVPHHILNQDLYQKALNTQAELMLLARSEKVRCDAANSLLTHLKMPETAKIELDVTVKENDAIAELKQSTLELVAAQRKMLEAGAMNAQEIAKMKVVQGTVIEVGQGDE